MNEEKTYTDILLEQVLQTTSNCIFWKDDRRRFQGANQAFLDYYGFSSLDSILGKTDEQMGWHQDPEPFRRDELRVLQGESTVRVHGTCMVKGEKRDIIASKSPLYRDGRIIGLVGIFEDVTEKIRAEAAYQNEIRQMESPMQKGMINKVQFDLTQDRLIRFSSTYLNESAVDVSRYSFHEMNEKICQFIMGEEDRKKLSRMLNREELIAAGQEGRQFLEQEYRYQYGDAVPVYAKTEVRLFEKPNGHMEGFIYTYDVTKHKLESRIISRLTEMGYDYIGLVDLYTGHYSRYDESESRMTRISESDSFWDVVRTHIQADAAEYDKKELMEKFSKEFFLQELEKERFGFLVYNKPENGGMTRKKMQFCYLDDRKDMLLFVRSDITKEYLDGIRHIQEVEAERIKADRANEAKSMFLTSMSHDLRTPLNGVLGFTDLALRTQDAQKREEYLHKIQSAGGLLLDMINDTLELSRIESGKTGVRCEAVDSHTLLARVLQVIEPTAARRNVTVTSDVSDLPDRMLWTDRKKLQKIMLNLISNAVKYTPEGGAVEVRFRKLAEPVQDCNYRLTVKDNGIGMEADFLPRLFEPFSQEHRMQAAETTGTGLGLAIVKKTVDLLKGYIRVRSQIDTGTEFEVDLPLEELENGLVQPEGQVQTGVLEGRIILLCEDNYLNMEIARTMLEDRHAKVLCAENGRECVKIFDSIAPGEIDAILMDVHMPVMDGQEAARLIRSRERPDAAAIPIIAMTASVFEEDIRKCLEAGMNGCMAKPIDMDKICRTLAEMMPERQNEGEEEKS